MTEQAFCGLKILDCTQGIGGPYCTKLLADFGAEVIKIEKPEEGDISRNLEPFAGDNQNKEKSGVFFYLNTNKQSLTLNLECDKGIMIFKELIKEADVLVENFKPGCLSKMGLSYDIVKQIKPDLIVVSISYFGQTGPHKDYVANNFTVSGLSGAMYTMRPVTRPWQRPAVEGGFQVEYSTGVLSFIALVGALINRDNTGQGTYIDMSAQECMASTLMGHVAEYAYAGLVRRTNPMPVHGYPTGYSVPCKDGWISLTPGIGGAPNIPFLIERPDLIENPIFTEPRTRMAAPEKFDNLMIPWLKAHSKWEITREAQKLRLAFTPVLSPGELTTDEQIQAREFLAHVEHPEMGKVIYPGAPAKLSESPWKPGRAPLLGEHNGEVLGRLGYTDKAVAQLRSEGVI
jgi:crotonobetainyl-CoA:carnitine CoA-transferase CaiB-like acyl-CoA transferase